MLTFIAVFLRIISNPLANVFQKQLTVKQAAPLFINFITYALLSLVSVYYAASVQWLTFSWQFWLYAMLVGFLGALGNGFLIKALQQGDLSVLGPINAYKAVVGLVAGFFLLGEIPGIWGNTGVLLIVLGSYVVVNTRSEKFSLAIFKRADIQFRVLAMVFSAIEAVFLKKVILYSSPEVSFITWCWFGAVFSALLLFTQRSLIWHTQWRLTAKHLNLYLLLVGCIGVMQLSTNYVFSNMPVGYALALFQLSALLSILFGHTFFQEREIARKVVGACVMVAGSVLIILFNTQ